MDNNIAKKLRNLQTKGILTVCYLFKNGNEVLEKVSKPLRFSTQNIY